MECIPAAQYLRMSTERQEYSLDCQSAGIASYAREHGFEVCQTYCDEAKSGLEIGRRAGLSQLLQDVVGGKQPYRAILVYDVSRWGRFQDPDEAAHYEFLCKAAGVQVHYCAEHFSNDGHLPSLILKTLKRVMAGEYSRELSDKVFAGLTRVVRKGFRTGAHPGYGFRRMLVSSDRTPKQPLAPGEHKSIATDRVILVPGPAHEVFWVREIYRLFTVERRPFAGIAAELELRGAPFLPGKQWSDHAVKRILTHPKFKGAAVYNRTTERLCSKSRRVPESEWILVPNAFEPIVSPEMFEAAQETLRQKFWLRSDEDVLKQLKRLLNTYGRLSTSIFRRHGLSPGGLSNRFGSTLKAYELIGYESPYQKTAQHRTHVRRIRAQMMQRVVEMFPGKISIFSWSWKRRNCLRLRNGLKVAVRVCRSIHLVTKGRMWVLQAAKDEPCRVTLMAGMNSDNTALEAFYMTGRLKNRSRLHITTNDEWLTRGVRLNAFRSFYEVVMSRRWN
ncbi:MAG TPA: recombinase family protein [Terriglobales bacterium]|nr:recombinase family protein [Terriglobales bacterium]